MTIDRPNATTVDRALTLTQPWATLVSIGAKHYETRSWPTNYRGWLAIHAAKNYPSECRKLWHTHLAYRRALQAVGYEDPRELPCAAVLCVARVVGCMSTNHWRPADDSDEFAFGNYAPDRYAFQLKDIRHLNQRGLNRFNQVRGKLGFWTLPQPITEQDLLPTGEQA